MLYVGGPCGAPKWVPMTDLMTFFYQMNDNTKYTCMYFSFPNDEFPSNVANWIRRQSYNGVKIKYEYPTSGIFYNINV